jgi:hypothetical protein
MSRCSVILHSGLRCRNNAYEVHGGKCFVHVERERKELRNQPRALPPRTLFDGITDVPRKPWTETKPRAVAVSVEACLPSQPCMECDRCAAVMDYDFGDVSV